MKKVLATTAFAATVALAGPAAAFDKINWDMQSTYASSLTQLGTLGKVISERLDKISDGQVKVNFQEPGAIVPALEAFDAVSSGAIQAAWSTPGYWTGKDTAFALFAAVPFGPSAGEYYAWIKYGGGKELYDELYEPYGIKALVCAVIAPEASGWFKKEINSVDDLKGLKMRFFGLGAKVMEKMGVSTQLLAGGDIFPALELGTIDATEFSMPAIDQKLGFYQVAKHYYFPGWHQQSTFFELMMNKAEWDGLGEDTKALFETVCEANVAYGLAEGEAIQFKALQDLKNEGVTIHKWDPAILEALNAAWLEVVDEEKGKNENFAKVWDSLSKFREGYAEWKAVGYLD
ncbi:TRAP-type mannitol/chloroaromatic compound transport system substrate-binding protein [Rhodobium orientis]|uniref:C4-dicarboxylate ABC transporter n=1 Tax=Rhodobium orientis TaxID=34017 RepID=A0A327JRF7_9HYPH|nr:TRAP transporter substrate-binding protein [Rhodobium orientis]MBB4304146.1 TRAP-type mannitol/chloroaromatic compound transport system substrate-binding protein [Rhodobium orientis]MBK5950617.1 C4-dicarboxylate ABC transporter [Rhodobium orientis]RAI28003.1 C4-dicarboxylate ABC transporter [Rhodobium orientis]